MSSEISPITFARPDQTQMNPDPDTSSSLESSRQRNVEAAQSNSALSNHSPFPRRSQSERVPQHRLPTAYEYDGEHDLPPLPHADMSSEARRQSLIAMDRKRRLTTSSHESGRRRTTTGGFTSRNNRYYTTTPRPDSHTVTPSLADQRDIIDLTSSSPPQNSVPPPLRTFSNSSRGYMVPHWQPDSEVSECPICHRTFSFLFRRHHCRKCGRVVCNDCSPHRITIPRQYIVHPPGGEEGLITSSNILSIDLTRSDDEDEERYMGLSTSHRRPNFVLGGREKVRLCNPCVPDPQPELQTVLREGPPDTLSYDPASNDAIQSPPPVISSFAQLRQFSPHHEGNASQLFRQYPHPGTRLHFDAEEDEDDLAFSPDGFTSSSRHHIMHGLNQSRYPPAPPPPPPPMNPMHSRYHSLDSRQPPLPPLPPFASRPRNHTIESFARMYGAVPSAFQSGIPSRPGPIGQPPSSSSASLSTAPRLPRPRISEEDMCPICRGMLPPKGPDGNETAREQHIMGCIAQHDTSIRLDTTPQSNSLPNPTSVLTQSFGASGPIAPFSQSQASSSNTPPLPRHAPTQMLRFTATEKDCGPVEGIEGEMQECSICMVEYDVGDRLVRLECWCKFHEECIVEWFGRKAECPVHKIS